MNWTELAPNSSIFFLEYNVPGFGPTASLAFPVLSSGLAVLSPPSNPTTDQLAFFDAQKGRELVALVAPHSGHCVGLADWVSKRPEVPVYAPGTSIPEVVRKVGKKDLVVKPLEDLETGPRIKLTEVFKSRNGSVSVSAFPEPGSGAPSILYADEFIMNCQPNQFDYMPWLFRQLFYWSGSVPGLKVNRVFNAILVQDYKAMSLSLKKALEECEEAAGEAGVIVVVSHGPPLKSKEEIETFKELLRQWS